MLGAIVNGVRSGLGPVNEFPYNQKVARKAHRENRVHLVVGALADFGRDFLVALFKALFHQVFNVVVLVALVVFAVRAEFRRKLKARKAFL